MRIPLIGAIIRVKGGLVESALSRGEDQVWVVDYDIDGVPEDELTVDDIGRRCCVFVATEERNPTELVARIREIAKDAG